MKALPKAIKFLGKAALKPSIICGHLLMKNNLLKHRQTLYLLMRKQKETETACEAWPTYEQALDRADAAEQQMKDAGITGLAFFVAAVTYYAQ
jgi:hypothetical protein